MIDFEEIIKSYQINGNENDMVWTGFPDIKYFDESIVRDEMIRKDLKKNLEEVVNYIKKYRELINEGVRDSDLFEYVQKIYAGSKKLQELFQYCNKEFFSVALLKTYNEIKSKSPYEIKQLNWKIIHRLKDLENVANTWDNLIKFENYSEKEKISKVVPFLTSKSESKMKNKRNEDRLQKVLKAFSYQKEFRNKKLIEILDDLNIAINRFDIFELINNHSFAQAGFYTIYYNYLCHIMNDNEDKGASFSENNQPLSKEFIKQTTVMDIEKVVMEEYNYSKYDRFIEPQLMSEFIMNYIEYIDLDKLFLLYMYRFILGLESINIDLKNINNKKNNLENENATEFDEKLNDDGFLIQGEYIDIISCKELCQKTYLVVNQIVSLAKIDVDSRIIVKFSKDGNKYINLKDIQEKMKLFAGDFYLTPNIEEYLKYKIYMNEDDTLLENKELLNNIHWNNDDLEYLILTNPIFTSNGKKFGLINQKFLNNLVEKVFNNEYDILSCIKDKDWNDVYIEKIISRRVPDISEFIMFLYKTNCIDEQNIKAYYNKGYINLEFFEIFDNNDNEKFWEKEEFLDSYKNYIEYKISLLEEPSEDELYKLEQLKTEKNKKVAYYKKYKMSSFNEDEKNENAESIMLEYADLFSDKNDNFYLYSFREMYKDDLISLENINNFDKEYLQRLIIDIMLKRGELSLGDTNKLKFMIDENQLIEIVENALVDDTINDDEKFILIMNVFCDENDKNTVNRERYLNRFRYANFKDNNISGQGSIVEKQRIKSKELRKSYNQYVYPDNIRWMFFNALDSNVRVKKYSNGYVEFFSPKFNSRIIEKYYEVSTRDNSIKGYAYGVSTYILSDDDYKNNMNSLIIYNEGIDSEAINEKYLRMIVPRENRIAHCKANSSKNWMRSILNYYSIDYNAKENSQYSNEEFNNLKKVIDDYSQNYVQIK